MKEVRLQNLVVRGLIGERLYVLDRRECTYIIA